MTQITPSIHITEVTSGTSIRLSMKAGWALDPEANNHNIMNVPNKARSARGYSRTVFFALILENNLTEGYIKVCLQSRDLRDYYEAVIPYSKILRMQLYLTDKNLPVETAPASQPGGKAFGTVRYLPWGGASLVNVKL